MRLEQYVVKANKTETFFAFISKGPNGNILKGVEYSKKSFMALKMSIILLLVILT